MRAALRKLRDLILYKRNDYTLAVKSAPDDSSYEYYSGKADAYGEMLEKIDTIIQNLETGERL